MYSKNDVAISVHDIHKEFVLPQHRNTTLKQTAVNIVKKNHKVTQKVLDGISFDIKKGEFFGIVGKNGSGKSTLLKLLAGIYTPGSGSIQVNGRLIPFIELGVGFSPELSGRDNVYLNAALLGFTRKETDYIYDEIVEFAELEAHMDKKLKNYSSGMQVRLAFSIAIKAKSDILIFDEVLAVGDEAFQKKCMDVFKDYRRSNQTVVLVTHSMESVRSLCTRALMLEDGKIVSMGSVDVVADAYQESNLVESGTNVKPFSARHSGKYISVEGCNPIYRVNDTMDIHVMWPNQLQVNKVGVAIVGLNDEYIFGSNTGKTKIRGNNINYKACLSLGPGQYKLTIALTDSDGNEIERAEDIARFAIRDDFNTEAGGFTRLEYQYYIRDSK